jgi:hypothetical protein
MATAQKLLDDVSTATPGPAVEVLTGREIGFHSFPEGLSGTLRYQGSFDGTHWFNLPSISTSLGVFAGTYTGPVKYVRASIEAISGGGVTALALQSDED